MEAYSSISHLVRSLRVESNYLDIEFCSDCGGFKQTVTVLRDSSEAGLTGESNIALASWFRSKLKRLLGPPEPVETLSQVEKETLTCRAFEQIKSRLRREDSGWVRAHKDSHPGEFFDCQLRANPIVEQYDIEVLVRVLLEISRSDSDFRSEEKAFLQEIVSDEATILRLSRAPDITVAELAETSTLPVKETILMLAWAMAYADGHLDYDEMTRLGQICRGFMLPEKRVRELQMAAKLFLLDRYFQAQKASLNGEQLKQSFEKRAQEWGLDEQQLQTLRSWYPDELS